MQPNAEDLYRQMYKSRRFEEAVAELWNDGHISAEMHLNKGEEAIVAGVLDHVLDGDALALEHRGTAPLVMRGVDLALLIKEFMGLEDGLCRGMGGHMHLFSASTSLRRRASSAQPGRPPAGSRLPRSIFDQTRWPSRSSAKAR
jgi:pyruvate dehydrogenase E1 component alpha subunit